MPTNDNGHYNTYDWGRGSVIYSFIFNKLILKDVLINRAYVEKSIKNLYMKGKILKKINWYSGLLIGSYYDYKYMVIQIKNGNILQKMLMEENEIENFYNEWTEIFLSSDNDDKYIFYNKMNELDEVIHIKPDELRKKLGRSELVSLDFSVPFAIKFLEIFCPSSDDCININNYKNKNILDELAMRKKYEDSAIEYLIDNYNVGNKYLPKPFIRCTNGT
jgi:hypothetical protein